MVEESVSGFQRRDIRHSTGHFCNGAMNSNAVIKLVPPQAIHHEPNVNVLSFSLLNLTYSAI